MVSSPIEDMTPLIEIEELKKLSQAQSIRDHIQ